VKFPRILGIEAVGEVVDNGGDGTWKKGDKVAAVMGDMGREFDGWPPIVIAMANAIRRVCRICEYAESKCE